MRGQICLCFFFLFTFLFTYPVNSKLQCKDCKYACKNEVSACYSSAVSWYSGNVVSAFNQRVITAAHIGEWKVKRGIPIFDPTRVKFLLDAIAKWNQGPLADGTIKQFFKLVINRTTLYEEHAHHPPAFSCSFFYDCKYGYETECKETCSVDDEDLSCWRDDINVYTKSLLVSINQMAIIEAHLAKALADEGRPPVTDAVVRRRIEKAKEINEGPLPDAYIEDIFRSIFKFTREFAETASSSSSLPEFDCDVSPSCRSAATAMTST